MRLIFERRKRRRAVCNSTAQCFVHDNFERLIRLPRDLRKALCEIGFQSQCCPHFGIMMLFINDVKMLQWSAERRCRGFREQVLATDAHR